MTLATHAITGAAIATLMPTHPVAAFAAGFASHFVIDAIPHYDYPIFSESIHPKKKDSAIRLDRKLSIDAIDFSVDAVIGIAVAIYFFVSPTSLITILAGAIGGILPDPLQVVAKKFPYEPLRSLQRFHQWIHTSYRLRESKQLVLGVVSQLLFIVLVIATAKTLL